MTTTSIELRLVYITTGSLVEARHIGNTLVEERLAACANIFPQMESVYRWKNELQHDQEVVLIAKTDLKLVDRLTERVKELHSYECPCVVALPADGGNPDYYAWLAGEIEAGDSREALNAGNRTDDNATANMESDSGTGSTQTRTDSLPTSRGQTGPVRGDGNND
ncbi:MAG: periplasmic divalent cation tolerance protein [Bacteroidetes bacterium HLUCCA01]|nr:MAG: periplasmic divalent cation tolerance protein [Bacteroidetes bacterium HLUCCA01]